MDERSRVERVVALPPSALSMGYRAQLLVDERKEPVHRRAIALLEGVEQSRNLVWLCLLHGQFRMLVGRRWKRDKNPGLSV